MDENTETSEATQPDIGGTPQDGGISEPSDVTRAPKAGVRSAAAAIAIVGVVALLVAFIAQTDPSPRTEKAVGTKSLPKLHLLGGGMPGGESADGRMAGSEMSAGTDIMAYPYQMTKYVLSGTLPNLGAAAGVYQMASDDLSADEIAAMSRAFGVEATPEKLDGADYGGESWYASDDSGAFSASRYDEIWSVSYSPQPAYSEGSGSSGECLLSSDGMTTCSSSASTGCDVATDGTEICTDVAVAEQFEGETREAAESGGGSSASSGSSDGIAPDDIAPDDYVTTEPYSPEPPRDLPSAAEAEEIARELFGSLGVSGVPGAPGIADEDWSVEVFDTSMYAMAYVETVPACEPGTECLATPSAVPAGDEEIVISSRSVVFTRMIGGQRVDGLSWSAEIGDEGVVLGAWGQIVDLTILGDYPLRNINEAFAALQDGDHGYPGSYYGDAIPLGAPEAMSSEGSTEPGIAEPPVTIEPMPVQMPDQIPEPLPDPEPYVITITGAELGWTIVPAMSGEEAATFIVPTYVFTGTYPDGGGDATVPVLALSPDVLAPVEAPEAMPQSKEIPVDSIEPQPAPTPDGDDPGGISPPSGDDSVVHGVGPDDTTDGTDIEPALGAPDPN